jgi:hypothetical protein
LSFCSLINNLNKMEVQEDDDLCLKFSDRKPRLVNLESREDADGLEDDERLFESSDRLNRAVAEQKVPSEGPGEG